MARRRKARRNNGLRAWAPEDPRFPPAPADWWRSAGKAATTLPSETEPREVFYNKLGEGVELFYDYYSDTWGLEHHTGPRNADGVLTTKGKFERGEGWDPDLYATVEYAYPMDDNWWRGKPVSGGGPVRLSPSASMGTEFKTRRDLVNFLRHAPTQTHLEQARNSWGWRIDGKGTPLERVDDVRQRTLDMEVLRSRGFPYPALLHRSYPGDDSVDPPSSGSFIAPRAVSKSRKNPRRRKARENAGERWIMRGSEVQFPGGGAWTWNFYVTVKGKNLTNVTAHDKAVKKMGLPPGAQLIGMRVDNTAKNLAEAHKHEKIGYHPLGKGRDLLARRNGYIHTPMTLTQQHGFTVHEGGGLVHELPDEKVVWLEVTSSSDEPGRVYVRSVLDRYGSWAAVEGVFYGDKGGGDDPNDIPAWVVRRKWAKAR